MSTTTHPARTTPSSRARLLLGVGGLAGCGLNTDHICTAYMEGVVEAAQYNEYDMRYGDTGMSGFSAWNYPSDLCGCPAEAELEHMSRDDAFELGWGNFCTYMNEQDVDCKGVETARKNIMHTGVDGKSPSLSKALWTGASGHGYDRNQTCAQSAQGMVDDDGDGFGIPKDCDDTNPAIHPDAAEICDGIDNDCDGAPDDSDDDVVDAPSWYIDEDGDGAGTDVETVAKCYVPLGFAAAPNDCDDTDDTIFEGATERCDGIDNDCDGTLSAEETDDDSDGFVECEDPSAWVGDPDLDFGDCDDTEATTHPGAEDTWYDGVDSDCAGDSDFDADGDGYDSAAHGGEDCDDSDPRYQPAATDGLLYDLNCDGVAVGGELSASDHQWSWDSAYVHDLSGAGDFDGGGRSDVLFAINGFGDDDGQVVQLYAGEHLDGPRDVDTTSPHLAFVHDLDGASEASGYLLADGGGDVNGDGLGDILLGQREIDLGATDGGAAFVMLGGPFESGEQRGLSTSDHTLLGTVADWRAGVAVAFAGDVDGDSRTDLLIGATTDRPSRAGVHLVLASELGSATTDLHGSAHIIEDPGAFDDAMSTAGDVDGDGLDDFLLGSNWDGALLYLAGDLGPAQQLTLADASVTFESQRCAGTGDGLASDLSPAGDVDNDGLDDFLLGAQYDCAGSTQAGAAFLVFGSNLRSGQTVAPIDVGAKFTGTGSYQGAGGYVSDAGDVDGDGMPDILVGTYLLTSSAYGRAWVVFGGGITDGTVYDLEDADRTLVSPYQYDGTGKVTHAGDMDGDNRSDVAVARNSAAYLMFAGPQ